METVDLRNRFDEAIDHYEEMVALAESHELPHLALETLAARIKIHATMSPKFSPSLAETLADRALDLARDLNEREIEAKIRWSQLLTHAIGFGNPGEGVVHGETSLEIARELDLQEQMAYALSDLGWAYAGLSQLGRSKRLLEEGRALWRDLGNLPLLANNLNVSCLVYFMRGEYEAALRAAGEAYEISQMIGNLWGQWSGLFIRGMVYVERDEEERAIETFEEAIQVSQKADLTLQYLFSNCLLAWAFASLGRPEKGGKYYQRARSANVADLHTAMRSTYHALFALYKWNLESWELRVKA